MAALKKLRGWINRDDGRFYQVGNRSLGVLEAIGLLVFVCSLVLWQLHAKTDLHLAWPLGTSIGGLLWAALGTARKRDDGETP